MSRRTIPERPEHLHILLTKDERARLHVFAASKQRSLADIVRESLERTYREANRVTNSNP
ncbi:MAG: hypothetical protein ABTD50_23290 [Polyangiaceae bacterium]|jgi:hypothetical protein